MPADSLYKLSVLDVSPVPSGSSSTEALQNTLDLARLADHLGFTRYWLAEHHNTPLIASSAPEIMIAHVADATSRIRVGSGGIMLPNHTPLKVAETFRVLEALHPGRVDLGIGRAPGTDPLTALALRRSRQALSAEDFPARLNDLLAFLDHGFPHDHPLASIRAMPDDVPMPEIWLLGSSDFSAILAAQNGLRFAFAHHIQPAPAVSALRLYHDNFQPSEYLNEPQALIGVSVVCAETDERARELALPLQLVLLRFRSGRMDRLPTIEEAKNYPYTPEEREVIEINRERSFVGSPTTVREGLAELADAGRVGEIMITTLTHEHADRRRSYQLLAEAFSLPETAAPRP
ncbi:MAG TPA: LLM class flavin-dependent oxidoreductase [Candidatus Acidoferrales bacterium]|nr:LLM class flavin-dependent oxidoreductase [Candidatus Acidoferrales bacterium]